MIRRLPALSARLLLAAVAAGPALAQSSPPPPAPRPAGPNVLAAFDVADGLVQDLVLPASATEPFGVELFVDGGARTLFLAPHSLRADDFQLLVQGADGAIRAVAPAPVATVRGFVVGYPESVFAGSLVDGALEGILRLRAGEPWRGLQALRTVDPTAPAAAHVLYDSADALELSVSCGTPDVAVGRGPATGPGAAEGGAASKWVEIACDADVQFYQANGSSVVQTQNDIENVLNGVDAIYDNDFDIRYLIGTILVRTAEPDPYSVFAASAMLDEFKFEWILNQSAIHRDVAHMFTGKNISGSTIGIAYLGGICSVGAGYGVSQSKFSFSMTSRVALTAHELGHNWTATHCNGTSPCNIMCSGLGGCSGGLTSFGPAASAEIEARKAVAPCLSGPPPTVPPTLVNATPDAFPAVAPGVVEVDGLELEWVEEVSLGGTVLSAPAGFFITSATKLFVTGDGTAPALGPNPLVATNAIGSSNALEITYGESSPPVLLNEFWALTGTDYTWKMGGEADDIWFLAISVGDDTTFPLLGFPLLVNGLLVAGGALDTVGVAKLTIELLPTAVGLTFFSQVATIDGGTGAFVGASPVKTSFVLL